MPILRDEDLTAEEQRHEALDAVFIDNRPTFAGFQTVRHVTPLVMVALRKANNPFVTARKGFEAMGLNLDGPDKTDSAEFGIAMMPKTAEVLILLSCSREELKRFASNPAALENAALDLVDGSTLEFMAEATGFVSDIIKLVSKAQAVQAPEDEKIESPAAPEGAGNAKKPALIG